MLKITIHADCGDAPKKQLLRDMNIAFARSDVEAILDFFTDDVHWRIVGETELRGKAAMREALEAMKGVVTRELIIHSIITGGREGAVHGVIISEDGAPVAFCDVVQFDSAGGNLIGMMTSFAIELNTER